MNLHKKLLCTAGAALLLSSTSLFAVEKSAVDIVKNAYQYIGSLDKYAFDAATTKGGESNKNFRQDVSVEVDRPGKLRIETKGDAKNRTVYLNDGMFTMMDHTYNYYGQVKAAKTIDGTLDRIFDTYGIKAPLASLIYSDMGKRVKFTKSKYFGTMDVAGVACDYVAFKTNIGEVHIWIATGDKPLIKTFSIISNQGEVRRDTSISWDTNPRICEKDFIFKAPKGASKISVKPAK